MRAVVYDSYGPPSVLRVVDDWPVPAPGPGQVLVRVAVTSVNLSDWETLVGEPAYARIGGRRAPARPILGSDIAGWVQAVGPDASRFQVGDEVYGDNITLKGGFAEFAVVPQAALALKPAALSFAEASAIPQAGAVAWHGMAGVAAGWRVLVNGAGGGSGTFAVQLAKAAGAHVTGVDNAGKLEFLRSLGADEVVDYQADDPTRHGPFDLVLDLVAHRSMFAWRRALARGGRYRLVGGSMSALLRSITIAPVIGAATGRRMHLSMVRQGPAGFGPVAELIAAGELAVPIERSFPLADVGLALAHVGTGKALGKVVVEVA